MNLEPFRLEALLAKARDVRVTVVGDLMLDIYLTGSVERISPEAPVPVVHVVDERRALGGAANVAANVVHLGANCDVIGCVGGDPAGEQLRAAIESLEGGAVSARLVACADRPTTTKTRVTSRRQQVARFDREMDDDIQGEALSMLCAFVRESVAGADVVVLEDYNKGVLAPEVIRTAISAATTAGIPIVIDPKFRNILQYHGATVIKPNSLELMRALGEPIKPHDERWLATARSRFQCSHLLVTLGEDGMVVASEGGATFRVPAIARDVYDVSGAGDTVAAFMAVALGAGADIHEATVLANFAAAIEVGKPGVATVSPDELRELVTRHSAEVTV